MKYSTQSLDVLHYQMKVSEFAGRLAIWLHKLCRRAFGKPPTALLRHHRVHQALGMMKHTNLGNTDIALQLCYSEESSVAREFRKELGYGPIEARLRLTQQTPEELLL